ncbi:MAG: site-specific integrase [Caldilineaceae bacterium]
MRSAQLPVGHKKAAHTSLTAEHAKQLKAQPDSPQGRRDAVIMTLLLDLGLRVGEVAILEVAHVNLKEGKLQVYRPKVDVQQTHDLSKDCLIALRNWIDSGDCGPFGLLLRGSRKGGELTEAGMSTTSISDRVRTLGKDRRQWLICARLPPLLGNLSRSTGADL